MTSSLDITTKATPYSPPYSPLTAAQIEQNQQLDEALSNRFIKLDPKGYFLIYLDREEGLICAAHYSNDINEQGLAVDPETGEPIPCKGEVKRTPVQLYTGRTAKELGIKLTEEMTPSPLTYLDHALYLGRELVRAELALISGQDYIQD